MKSFLFSHRGDTRLFMENTMEAFNASLESGVLGIETDVQLSSFGELLLFHDDKLDRLLGREGCFHDLTQENVNSFKYSHGEKIPNLNELLFWLKEKPKMKLYLELKFPDYCSTHYIEKLVKECIKSLTRIGFPKNSLIGSFDLCAVKIIKRYLVDLELDWPVFFISETMSKVEDATKLGLDKNLSLRIDLYQKLSKEFTAQRNIVLWGINMNGVDERESIFAWVPDL
jgi:glycerophosphoryl diester phosphodiesterase